MLKEDDILKNRKNIYTKNIASSYLQRAENVKLSLRRDQLENYIEAKRLKLYEPLSTIDTNILSSPEKILNLQELNLRKELSLSDILDKLKILLTNSQNWYEETILLKECIIGVRKITCRQLNKEGDKIFKNEIHILLIKILEYYQSYEGYTIDEEIIIHETLWAITNLSCISGSDIFRQIKFRNTLIILRNYLYSSVDRIIDQSALCLGNIIVETNEFRDMAINLGILDKAVNISKDITKPVELIKNCMFLISNILRGRPKPQLEKIAPSLAIISACLWNKDEEIVKSCLWSISYISDGYENIQNTIISTGCLTKVLEYAMINKKDFQLPSLRIMGNLAAGPKKIVERLLKENVIKTVIDLLEITQENYIKIELFWILKNFSDSTVDTINHMISFSRLNSMLIKISVSDLNYEYKIEVLNIFYNYAKKGNKFTIKKLIESELLDFLCNQLEFNRYDQSMEEIKYIMLCLGVLNKMLSAIYKEKINENDIELADRLMVILNKYMLKEKFEMKMNFMDMNNNNNYASGNNNFLSNGINELIMIALKTIKLIEGKIEKSEENYTMI